jgi:hypothetical protein
MSNGSSVGKRSQTSSLPEKPCSMSNVISLPQQLSLLRAPLPWFSFSQPVRSRLPRLAKLSPASYLEPFVPLLAIVGSSHPLPDDTPGLRLNLTSLTGLYFALQPTHCHLRSDSLLYNGSMTCCHSSRRCTSLDSHLWPAVQKNVDVSQKLTSTYYTAQLLIELQPL